MAMSRGQIEFYKEHYPAGTRDDPCPVPAGTKGTVIAVDDIGSLHVKFDNGRLLGICPEVDSFHKISDQTEVQEPKMSM